MTHGEAARLFFPPSTSKANRPKIVIQIKHPVNCTQAAGFLSHIPPHTYTVLPMLPTSREPRFTHLRRRHLSKTGFVLSGVGHAKVAYRSCLWCVEAWHNTWPFVKHSHYRQQGRSEPHPRIEAHATPEESGKRKSILLPHGYSSRWDLVGVWRIVLCFEGEFLGLVIVLYRTQAGWPHAPWGRRKVRKVGRGW